jgi:hypothetical protein
MTKQDVINEINRILDQSYTTAETVREVLNTLLDYSDDGITQNRTSIEELERDIQDQSSLINGQQQVLDNYGGQFEGINATLQNHEERIIALENEEQNLLFSHFITDPLRDLSGNIDLWYSFRGVENKYANYTFAIKALKAIRGVNPVDIVFDFRRPELLNILKKIIIEGSNLSFVVAINNRKDTEGRMFTKLATTTIEISKDENPLFIHRVFPYNIIDPDGRQEEIILDEGDIIETSIIIHRPAFKTN